MKRRDFLSLCGLVAGSCLVPDAMARVIRETCVLAREPYLILPRNPSDTLYALSFDGKTDFMLHLGDPQEPAQPPTWREYFDEFECIDIDDKKAVEAWWLEQVGDPEDEPISIKPDDEIDGVALEKWEWQQEITDGPSARAFHHLSDLPLDDGHEECAGQRLGLLRFIEGDRPGSNLTYVEAPDLATLACLQNRLNELGEDIALEIKRW
jgi:hypothetical protein